MEHLRLGGRPTVGFGVGVAPPSTFVKPAMSESILSRPSGKVGAFLGGAAMSAVAAVAATALFGEGSGAMVGAGQRLRRNWRSLAATAVVGGIVGAVAS
jgi:hypothetical protein